MEDNVKRYSETRAFPFFRCIRFNQTVMAKIDTFTKILLVVIAIFIGMIALKPILSTEVAQANPGQL